VTATATARRLVFDTSCLSHFARADRLDVLGDLLGGTESYVPHVVREEIRDGSDEYPELTQILDLEWLRVVALDTLDRLRRFTIWAGRLGSGTRDLGEASVLAVAEELDAIALIDERSATRVGRSHGVDVHGTLWLSSVRVPRREAHRSSRKQSRGYSGSHRNEAAVHRH
jgi:predicted nucleic acid-binding protein